MFSSAGEGEHLSGKDLIIVSKGIILSIDLAVFRYRPRVVGLARAEKAAAPARTTFHTTRRACSLGTYLDDGYFCFREFGVRGVRRHAFLACGAVLEGLT